MHTNDQRELAKSVENLKVKYPEGYGDASYKIPISGVRVIMYEHDEQYAGVGKIAEIGEFDLNGFFLQSGLPAAHVRNWFDGAPKFDEIQIEPVFREDF